MQQLLLCRRLGISAPSALTLTMILDICSEFASQIGIAFNTRKTIVLFVAPPGKTIERRPKVYLNRYVLTYVKVSKCLGHIINEIFNDDDDIGRERRKLAGRVNILIRK